MTREEAIQFAHHAQTMTDIPEVKEFYAMAETALRQQEQKCARWVCVPIPESLPRYRCSRCGHYVDAGDDRNFCPNCGAEMSNGGIFHETS